MLVPQLEDRKAENEAMCETQRERIQQLWDRLQVPQEKREALSEHMVQSKKRNLEAVRQSSTVLVSFLSTLLFCVVLGQSFLLFGSPLVYLLSSVKRRGPASGGAQTTKHP